MKSAKLGRRGLHPWNKGLTKETDARIAQKAAKAKEYQTKKANNSFNSSKIEKELIENLIKEYGEDNFVTKYLNI